MPLIVNDVDVPLQKGEAKNVSPFLLCETVLRFSRFISVIDCWRAGVLEWWFDGTLV